MDWFGVFFWWMRSGCLHIRPERYPTVQCPKVAKPAARDKALSGAWFIPAETFTLSVAKERQAQYSNRRQARHTATMYPCNIRATPVQQKNNLP